MAGCLLSGVASKAAAGISGDQALDAADASEPDRPPSFIHAESSFGVKAKDELFILNFRLNHDMDLYGFGLQLPLRLRLGDSDPQNDEYLDYILAEDWDEPADALRILRYVYVGQSDRKGPYYFRGGELRNLSLGHGTLMHRYHNGMDASRWRFGFEAATNVGAFGARFMTGDVVQPHLMGARVHFSPGKADSKIPVFQWLVAGATFVADWTAPFALETSADGRVQVDETDLPRVREERVMTGLGLDFGLEIPVGERVVMTPYMDMNALPALDHGLGFHTGVLFESQFPLDRGESFTLSLRGEYRLVSGDYVGPYFDTVYEIERYQRLATSGGTGESKARYHCVSEVCENDLESRNGVFFEVQTRWPRVFALGGAYIAYGGGRPDGSIRLSLELPVFDYFELKSFYYRINTDSLSDLFALDGRSALVNELRIPLLKVVSANFRWWRVWETGPNGYDTVDDWSAGISVLITLFDEEEPKVDPKDAKPEKPSDAAPEAPKPPDAGPEAPKPSDVAPEASKPSDAGTPQPSTPDGPPQEDAPPATPK